MYKKKFNINDYIKDMDTFNEKGKLMSKTEDLFTGLNKVKQRPPYLINRVATYDLAKDKNEKVKKYLNQLHPFTNLKNLDAINTYHRIFPSDKPYLVVDKQKGVLGIYKNGQLLKQERIFRGQHTGDADIPLPINGYGIRTKRGNNMSGAGIFNIRSVAMEVGHRDPRTLKELNHPDGTRVLYSRAYFSFKKAGW